MFAIETERLRLRLFQPDDLQVYYDTIHSDAEVMRYILGETLPIERTQQWIERFTRHQERYGFSVWAVTARESGTFLGQTGLLTLPDRDKVELDYAFGQAHWSKGYATEAARAALRFGFEQAGLAQVYALSFPENRASQRVMRKLGMSHQGRSRDFFNLDLEVYTIERSAFPIGNAFYEIEE